MWSLCRDSPGTPGLETDVSRVSWKQAARSANEAARFLAERLHEVSGQLEKAERQRDWAMENRNQIASENQELIERLTRKEAS